MTGEGVNPRYTLEEAAAVTGGKLLGPFKDVGFSACSIDTRTLVPGECYVAVKGENHDGHDFVAEAFRRGAAAALVSRRPEGVEDRPLLVVGETVRAFQALARHARRKWPMKVIGITGSMGKTTAKELVALAMSARFSVLATEGNLNSQVGLPLCMLRRDPSHEIGVFEMGMSRPGEITRLAWTAEPSVGIVTNLAPVHLEFFQTIERIADAKKELIDALPADGLLVANADDPWVMRIAQGFAGETITYGIDSDEAQVRGLNLAPHKDFGMACTVRVGKRGPRVALTLDLPGRHFLSNALAAMACAAGTGVDPEAAARKIATFQAMEGRGRTSLLSGGTTLIDDSYNSNPQALLGSVEAAAALKSPARRLVVVSGDMLELGPTEAELHREAGRALAEAGVDCLVAVGPLAEHLAEGARKAGLSDTAVFATSEEAAASVVGMIRPGDIVLVKGSRGIRTDLVARRIKEALDNTR